MVRRLLAGAVGLLLVALPLHADDDAQLRAIFATMEQQGKAFNPEPLVQLGPAGVEAVFDRWLPQSRLTQSRQPIAELMRELATNLASEEYKVRQDAVERLTLFGEQARPHVVEASRSEDREVRLLANTILAAWSRQGTPAVDGEQRRRDDCFREACGVYLSQLDGDERLKALLNRVMLALEVGLQPHDCRTRLRPCLRRVANLGDRWINELRPVLQHDDPQVPVFVIHAIGGARPSDFFPELLLHALASDRPEIVEAALSWSLNHGDERRGPDLKTALRKLLDQPNESLKFQACWPLLHDFRDEDARAYLLSQLRADDLARVRTALGWLGDERNRGSKAMLEALPPLLKHENELVRLEAAQALAKALPQLPR
jgi:HEAT repeat protein